MNGLTVEGVSVKPGFPLLEKVYLKTYKISPY